jgi:hypothetical protein
VPKWRNWQTRYVQGVVGESLWEFESPLRHHTPSVSESPEPGGLDVVVLHHLRGFPDELHRFSNVLKQTHGRSAVEFFLSRPASPDSFLAALCRAARDGEDVVTVIEAAELLGRPAASLLTPEAETTLPLPFWGTDRHRLWRRTDLMRYAAQAGRADSGTGTGGAAPGGPTAGEG